MANTYTPEPDTIALGAALQEAHIPAVTFRDGDEDFVLSFDNIEQLKAYQAAADELEAPTEYVVLSTGGAVEL